MTSFERLFDPRSVAVVGASPDENKMASRPIDYLRRRGYRGRVYGVNPKYESVLGAPCVPSVSRLPEVPDVVYILVPAAHVPDVVAECGVFGVPFVVISSSGFAETGSGAAMQETLLRSARTHGMRIVGPNCEGIWNVPARLLLTFGTAAGRSDLRAGDISILSQSGSIAGALAQRLFDETMGVDVFVSTGNEVDVDVLEFLSFVLERPSTRVIALFLEGLREGQRLLDLGRRALSLGKPIVALRAGSSPLAQQAIRTHTGKIVGEDATYDAAFRQSGIVRVSDLRMLEAAVRAFSVSRTPVEKGPAILSISGGSRALFADACQRMDVHLPAFGANTRTRLGELTPDLAVIENPADVTGDLQSDIRRFAQLIEIAAEEPACGSVIVQLAARGREQARQLVPVFGELVTRHQKPFVLSCIAGLPPAEVRSQLAALGVHCVDEPASAIRVVSWLSQHERWRRRSASRESTRTVPMAADPALTWSGLSGLLESAGIPVAATIAISSEADLDGAIDQLGLPVLLKLPSDEFPHKSDVGGVRIVRDRLEGARDYRELRRMTDSPIQLQEFVSDGVEVLVSVRRDPDMGPTVQVGFGGVAVEITRRVATRLIPVVEDDLREMFDEVGLDKILAGFRGRASADDGALIRATLALTDLFVAAESLDELELNPVMVLPRGRGIRVVDILAVGRPVERPLHKVVA